MLGLQNGPLSRKQTFFGRMRISLPFACCHSNVHFPVTWNKQRNKTKTTTTTTTTKIKIKHNETNTPTNKTTTEQHTVCSNKIVGAPIGPMMFEVVIQENKDGWKSIYHADGVVVYLCNFQFDSFSITYFKSQQYQTFQCADKFIGTNCTSLPTIHRYFEYELYTMITIHLLSMSFPTCQTCPTSTLHFPTTTTSGGWLSRAEGAKPHHFIPKHTLSFSW